jgi:hypothetical protein
MNQYELIEMKARRFGYFPRTFTWRDLTIQVTAVVRVWSKQRGLTINRHYFQVRCADGIERTVYQDLIDQTWHVAINDSEPNHH